MNDHNASQLTSLLQVSAAVGSAVEVEQNSCALLYNTIYTLLCSGYELLQRGVWNIPRVTGFVPHRRCSMCHCAVPAGTPTSPAETDVETGHIRTESHSIPRRSIVLLRP